MDSQLKNRFNPANNPSSRAWRGAGGLSRRDIGGWDGRHILGVIGALEGRYDKKFVKWCVERELLFVRTVDLFWAFENFRYGFYRGVSTHQLRKRWKEDKSLSQSTELCVAAFDGSGRWRTRRATPAELREWMRERDPGPWKSYYRRKRKYFLNELARYKRVLKFWRNCGRQARQNFLRCARYSNKQADGHPDYLIAVRDGRGRVVDSGFVEVKGPRESLRPSQRKFFPELVRCAGQKVWLARFPMRGNSINFGQFTPIGEVRTCGALQSMSYA